MIDHTGSVNEQENPSKMKAKQNMLSLTWPWGSSLADCSFESFEAQLGLGYWRTLRGRAGACDHGDSVACIMFAAGGKVASTIRRSEVYLLDPFCVQFVCSPCLCIGFLLQSKDEAWSELNCLQVWMWVWTVVCRLPWRQVACTSQCKTSADGKMHSCVYFPLCRRMCKMQTSAWSVFLF